MQNQLSSLTAEQRASQAMSLLIYNTYTGPGTTAKVNSSNPLNTFIAKELNQWAQNNLKGVDLSFGVDTYDQTANGGTQRTRTTRTKSRKNLFNNRVRAVIGGKFSTDADPTENLNRKLNRRHFTGIHESPNATICSSSCSGIPITKASSKARESKRESVS
ncbi:MAG: hypothetical protein ACLTZY_14770 [Alistipes indistinctus]